MTILKEIRESCKMSTAELSRRSGVHRRDIYNLESGRHSKRQNFHKVIDTLSEMVELAYIAGLVDRSASITITKNKAGTTNTSRYPSYISKFCVHSVHEEIPEIIRKVLKAGEVTTLRPTPNNRKTKNSYEYYAHCKAAGVAIEKLLPYLKIKRNKALTLLEFREKVEYTKAQRSYLYETNGPGYDWDQNLVNAVYEEYYQRIRQV